MRRRAKEVYEDGYFARKVIGVGRLIPAWRWADKLQRDTNEKLRWAPNEMARSAARLQRQEADRYVKCCEAEEVEYCLHTGRRRAPGSCWRGAARILAPGGIISFSIVRFQFYALYLVVKYHHVHVMILYIYIYFVMN